MQRALEIAQNGRGNVSPNPMVGCVLVHEDRIIGEGYHREYGQAHAEVNAINAVKNKSLLSKSTMYVTLEPCSHFGKTPPCADLIVKHKIPEVFIATLDSNPKVSGKGVDILMKNNIKVHVGLLEKEAKWLNRRFFTFHEHKRPYIILKWAQTLDGFMDCNERNTSNRISYWITNRQLQYQSHKWRTEEDAIFCGANTLKNDNPQLNSRLLEGKNPIRMTYLNVHFVDNFLHFFDNSQPSWIFNHEKEEEKLQTRYLKIERQNALKNMLNLLYEQKVQSIIVEGGQHTLLSFLNNNLWDEARVLIGNTCFSRGLSAPKIEKQPSKIENFGKDKILYYYH